jgi:hypothetical protein
MEIEWVIKGGGGGIGMGLVLEKVVDDRSRWVVGRTREGDRWGFSRWEDANVESCRHPCTRTEGGVGGTWW